MKRLFSLIALTCTICLFSSTVQAQNFKAKQKEQEKTIKSAYKAKKITQNEYEKLIDEQQVIKNTIEKYELDGELDSHEKNVIHDKLIRAQNRLKRYKTNGEIY